MNAIAATSVFYLSSITALTCITFKIVILTKKIGWKLYHVHVSANRHIHFSVTVLLKNNRQFLAISKCSIHFMVIIVSKHSGMFQSLPIAACYTS
jgi:hypothetical protein